MGSFVSPSPRRLDKPKDSTANEPGTCVDLHQVPGRVERVDQDHVKYFLQERHGVGLGRLLQGDASFDNLRGCQAAEKRHEMSPAPFHPPFHPISAEYSAC
jgi:hypothetical protein